ncbi:hypothetical protein HK097_005542 [Rhizophlyctis rosea]|uniref:Cyclin N-terminal domain-containing protein n=1 Tax=Rhizophlyctis rosea TaxID=64517 RepID=A0AAD5SQZ5_9FUNG|nr:hypothetical protein HK097_005542 [Rhizophlyctis rosea]
MSLTKIRKLKVQMLQVAEIRDLELSSLASAYVYFEKLVLKQIANKYNRRLLAGVCLLLACKVNDPKELNYARLLETVEKVLEVPPKEVYAHEFSVYAALEFTLFLPLWEIMPHLERIVDASTHTSVEEYLKNRTFFYSGH